MTKKPAKIYQVLKPGATDKSTDFFKGKKPRGSCFLGVKKGESDQFEKRCKVFFGKGRKGVNSFFTTRKKPKRFFRKRGNQNLLRIQNLQNLM